MLPIILKQINVNTGWWTCKNNTNTQLAYGKYSYLPLYWSIRDDSMWSWRAKSWFAPKLFARSENTFQLQPMRAGLAEPDERHSPRWVIRNLLAPPLKRVNLSSHIWSTTKVSWYSSDFRLAIRVSLFKNGKALRESTDEPSGHIWTTLCGTKSLAALKASSWLLNSPVNRLTK